MGCYGKKHKNSECDKCLKDVGEHNLFKVPFLYCDDNDDMHEDVSWMTGHPEARGYRQYYVCKECNKFEVKRN